MVHQFDVEVLLAVDVLQFAGGAQRLVELPQAQARLHDARRAARPADHALAVRGEHVLVHTRIAHHTALEVGHRRRLRQVDQALVTLRPQCQMGIEATTRHVVASLRLGAPVHTRLVAARRLRRHIRLDAQDRLDALLDRLAPQLIRAMHVAMVRDADRRHAQVLGAPDQIRDLRGAVKQRIMRVVVQLNKVCGLSHKVQIYPFRMTVRKGPRHRLRAMRMVRRVAWRHAVRARPCTCPRTVCVVQGAPLAWAYGTHNTDQPAGAPDRSPATDTADAATPAHAGDAPLRHCARHRVKPWPCPGRFAGTRAWLRDQRRGMPHHRDCDGRAVRARRSVAVREAHEPRDDPGDVWPLADWDARRGCHCRIHHLHYCGVDGVE